MILMERGGLTPLSCTEGKYVNRRIETFVFNRGIVYGWDAGEGSLAGQLYG